MFKRSSSIALLCALAACSTDVTGSPDWGEVTDFELMWDASGGHFRAAELFQSVWQVYLVRTTELAGNLTEARGVYPLPGRDYFVTDIGDSEYRHTITWAPDESLASIRISRVTGSGEPYDNIHVIRIQPAEIVDTQTSARPLIPPDLDLSDYAAVVEHYGLTTSLRH